ncbi:MAG TPA: hypothetical protein PKZ32_18515 [Candidatus Melainabacteria bacterium]|nr:hypothetical protein [Candidatus Melainabacteria bacterium]
MANQESTPLRKPSPALAAGLALCSMSMMLLELVMTRLYSASTGYHFAFMIVSIAMFGLTLGALYTMAFASKNDDKTEPLLSLSSCLFAAAIPTSAGLQILAFKPLVGMGAFAWIFVNFLLSAIPFFFAGIVICKCLTSYEQVGKLYSADLLGAAVACPLLVFLLSQISGPYTLIVSGVIAAAACLMFALTMSGANRTKGAVQAAIGLLICIAWSFSPTQEMSSKQIPGIDPSTIEAVKWSPISRIIVAKFVGPALTWASVPAEKQVSKPIPQKGLYIDSGAFTVMTGKATPEEMLPIKQDITAVANRLRPGNSLFVIGVGGGRDILTGRLFDQKKIDGLEVNPVLVKLLKQEYADFNGHLAEQPGVNIVNDEARNWLSRSGNQYGIIQCSLVDTYAASTSGAFVLTENSLYTKEAVLHYLKHLEPKGVLSLLRWGNEEEPQQLTRLLYLTKDAFKKLGLSNIEKHVMLICAPYRLGDISVGNMLVSKEEFSHADIELIQSLCKELGYKALLLPDLVKKEPFYSALTNPNDMPSDLPSEDRPFFFSPATELVAQSKKSEGGAGGLALVLFTLLLTIILVAFTIVAPAWIKFGRSAKPEGGFFQSAGYFLSIGFGFILIEVGLIERLSMILGNPTLSLSLVLFVLLLASGSGSYVAQNYLDKGVPRIKLMRISLLVSAFLGAALAGILYVTGMELALLELIPRASISALMVALPGFFMGWAFPLGLGFFGENQFEARSWFWAVNGGATVCGSVLAAVLSIEFGICITMILGAACYILGIFCAALAVKPEAVEAQS